MLNNLQLISSESVDSYINLLFEETNIFDDQSLILFFIICCSWVVFGIDAANINHIQMEIWFAWLIWCLIVANWAKFENQDNP